MTVYLIRHGVAVSVRDTPSHKHEDRPLTDDGATRMKVQAASFRRIGGVVQEVWTSPHLRARQSAEIVRDVQDTGVPVIEVEDLAPEGEIACRLMRTAMTSRLWVMRKASRSWPLVYLSTTVPW